MNHLTRAEAEVYRLVSSPRTPESVRRIQELQAIIAEHQDGAVETAFPK